MIIDKLCKFPGVARIVVVRKMTVTHSVRGTLYQKRVQVPIWSNDGIVDVMHQNDTCRHNNKSDDQFSEQAA